MVKAFRAALAAARPPLDYRAPKYSPDVGAALYAARLAGAPLKPDALSHEVETMILRAVLLLAVLSWSGAGR